jgi:hypothetical protein
MPNVDMDWVKEQFIQTKTRKAVGDAVLKLLTTWDELKERTGKNDAEIVEVFGKLSLGHALIKENKDENWIPARAGDLKVTDTVRVRFDAFDSASGRNHLNGRRGKVVGVRYGDIVVKSTDEKTPVLDGVHFRPENLEKLV